MHEHHWAGKVGHPLAHCTACRRGRTEETAAMPCEGSCLCAHCGHHIDEHQSPCHPDACTNFERGVPHEWEFRCCVTSGVDTRALFRCQHCGQCRLGERRHGAVGVWGPYKVWNRRATCPTSAEEVARRVDAAEAAAATRAVEKQQLAEVREAVAARATAAGTSPDELPLSHEEAKAIYDAGYSSGLERGADGGSFEAALRAIGRDPHA